MEQSHLLAREAMRLRLALEALPHPLVVWDERGDVVLRNRSESDPVIPPAAGPLVDASMEELGRTGADHEPVTRTLDLRGPPPRQLVLRGIPLRQDQDSLGTVAVVDDVSERRRLDAIRRDFVANVSHELRTPVGALALLGEALREETDPVVVARLADRINVEVDRAARMIEDLLDLSRSEADGGAEYRPLDVEGVVAAGVERGARIAEKRKVRLITSTERTNGIQVMGDEVQLVSAVANLVDNGVKYSDPGSSVKVRTRLDEGHVLIAVRDRGIGIPSNDLERIFERFYRVDRARSRGTGGTGLGLSIVRHVVTNHGGEVFVESCEGEGSTFTLRLPAITGD
jgi:two-component system, OmpR family, sensor histidine kinase SenX3